MLPGLFPNFKTFGMPTTKRRFANAINASSMADIAFLLLIFFLVTTTILLDQGILVKLPPYDEQQKPMDVRKNNVLSVFINAQDQLMLGGEILDIAELRERVKTFVTNPEKRTSLPASPGKAIVSLQNDRGTSYEFYLLVYNELRAAYRELHNEAALERYGKFFEEIPLTYQKEIRKEIPMTISEAEPTEHEPEN